MRRGRSGGVGGVEAGQRGVALMDGTLRLEFRLIRFELHVRIEVLLNLLELLLVHHSLEHFRMSVVVEVDLHRMVGGDGEVGSRVGIEGIDRWIRKERSFVKEW